jgi:hypothetical protein
MSALDGVALGALCAIVIILVTLIVRFYAKRK